MADVARERSEPGGPRSLDPDDLLSALMLVARLVLLLLFALNIARGRVGGPDVVRFRQIALHPGTPWRDFPVEFAPLQGLAIRMFFGASLRVDALVLAIVAFAADVTAFAVLRSAGGRRAGLLYLLVGLPLQGFIYQRIDLVSAALAVAALGLARRRRERMAGIASAAAVLFKLWPAAIIPAFLLGRHRRALAFAIAAVVAGGVAWIAFAGVDAPSQVSTFRGATGWQEESAIGSIVLIATGGPERLEAGAIRVGTVPGWAPVALAAVLLLALASIWFRASRTRDDPAGAPSLVGICVLLLLSPVFSTQYVSWLLPWVAIAGSERRRTLMVTSVFGATLLTGALDSLRNAAGVSSTVVGLMSLARNALLVVVVVAWFAERHDDASVEAVPPLQ